jgi:type IV secretory pathway VirJ component
MRILVALLLGLAFTCDPAGAVTRQTMQTSAFGQVVLVNHADKPRGLVILFADEHPQQRDSLADALADLDYAVAQVQPKQWLAVSSNGDQPDCVDIAAAVQSLEHPSAASRSIHRSWSAPAMAPGWPTSPPPRPGRMNCTPR